MKIFLLICLAAATLPAYGIGRSGNGNFVGERDGYSIGKIETFTNFALLESERARLISPVVATMESTRLFLELAGAKEGLPLLAKLPRKELLPRMEKLGWARVEHSDPCVEAFRQSVDTGDKLALFWGGEKGFVAIGPKNGNVALALDEIRSKLKLKPGACAW